MNKIIGATVATIATIAIAGTLAIGYLDYNTSKYICDNCRKSYKPTLMRWVSSVHIPTHRHMKCPICGEGEWHKKVRSN